MGTVIDLDEGKGWKLPPRAVVNDRSPAPNLLPPALSPENRRDRAQLAHLQMLDRGTVLMSAIADLVHRGFVPIGFTAHLEDGLTVMVEVPADALVNRRQDLAITTVRGHNYVWFLHGGVRVAWQFTVPKDAA